VPINSDNAKNQDKIQAFLDKFWN